MGSFNIIKRELCLVFIERGKHISTAERYIKDRFDLSESNLTCVIVKIQKYLLPEFKSRWNKSGRIKTKFLQTNQKWLDGEFSVSFEGANVSLAAEYKRGRACRSYKESAKVTQHRKAIKLFRESGLDHIQHAYIQGLRSLGNTLEALIVQELRSTSSQTKEFIYQLIKKRHSSTVAYSTDEALAVYTDLALSKSKYECLKKA